MQINQKWFALLPGNSKVQTIQIKEITEATVLVEDLASQIFGINGTQSRYLKTAIKLVEELPDNYEYLYANTN